MTLQDLRIQRTYIIEIIDHEAGISNRKRVMQTMLDLLPANSDLSPFDMDLYTRQCISHLRIKHLQMPPRPRQIPDTVNIQHLMNIIHS